MRRIPRLAVTYPPLQHGLSFLGFSDDRSIRPEVALEPDECAFAGMPARRVSRLWRPVQVRCPHLGRYDDECLIRKLELSAVMMGQPPTASGLVPSPLVP